MVRVAGAAEPYNLAGVGLASSSSSPPLPAARKLTSSPLGPWMSTMPLPTSAMPPLTTAPLAICDQATGSAGVQRAAVGERAADDGGAAARRLDDRAGAEHAAAERECSATLDGHRALEWTPLSTLPAPETSIWPPAAVSRVPPEMVTPCKNNFGIAAGGEHDAAGGAGNAGGAAGGRNLGAAAEDGDAAGRAARRNDLGAAFRDRGAAVVPPKLTISVPPLLIAPPLSVPPDSTSTFMPLLTVKPLNVSPGPAAR